MTFSSHYSLAEKRVKNIVGEKKDFAAYYYEPVTARYHEYVSEETNKTMVEQGS